MAFGKDCHLILIDGSNFILRAYHALPPLTRKSDGLPVGAVAGFCNLLWRELTTSSSQEAPTHLAVVFDARSVTFRNEIYPEYKSNRPELPEDLRSQLIFTREATRAFNVPCIEIDGYEADNIIATLARRAREAGGAVTIISSEQDLMQLVSNGVDLFDPMKNKRIGLDEVLETFGVIPERVADVQALAGDSVDNVPGTPGIGIKTAALLINEFGSLEALLERAGEVVQPKWREALVNNAELIRSSKRLMSLDADMPLDAPLEALELREPKPERLIRFLKAMEFRTLTRRVADKLNFELSSFEPKAKTDLKQKVSGGLPVSGHLCVQEAMADQTVKLREASYKTPEPALLRWILAITTIAVGRNFFEHDMPDGIFFLTFILWFLSALFVIIIGASQDRTVSGVSFVAIVASIALIILTAISSGRGGGQLTDCIDAGRNGEVSCY